MMSKIYAPERERVSAMVPTPMGRSVVTITEAVGSGAAEIGRLVGERLGIPVVDREVLQRAAQEAGVSPETIEEAERAPSFLARMVEWLGVYSVSDGPLDLGPLDDIPTLSGITNQSYRQLIEDVIRNIADTSEAIIIGHAAHVILRDHSNVLRVYLSAPLSTRVARVSEMEGIDRATAQKMVREHDTVRRTFFEDHYKVRRNEAQNYDLCLRTDKLRFDACADLICAAVKQVAE